MPQLNTNIPKSVPKSIPVSKQLSNFMMSISKELLYALKRAGDWGQVENCKSYKKIFVTSDKLAALYAFHRGIRFIYLRRQFSGPSMIHLKSLYRYSFVLF